MRLTPATRFYKRVPQAEGLALTQARQGQPRLTYLLFGKSGSGDLFGLQKKPGLATCGSTRPSLSSCP